QHYGDRIDTVLALLEENPTWARLLVDGYPYLEVEVIYAARYEMAGTIRDFLARRIRLEILNWDAAQQATPMTAKLLGQEFGWAETKVTAEAEAYLDFLYELRELAQEAVAVS
ncbi:MAG: glycerol-3-phosphate dehydrogenase C-terminal domain-containing protein, partial [Bacteroidota bacterium]